MISSILCYAEPVGYLASRGYDITCTRQKLILPYGDQTIEFHTPFARVILTKALQYVEPGLGPGLVNPGAMPAAIPDYISKVGKTGVEAEFAAVELFCSDEICESNGGPNKNMFLVKSANAKIFDHVSYTDEGMLIISGFKLDVPYYKVFEISDILQAIPINTLVRYLSNCKVSYWQDDDFLYVSNTLAVFHGCPPSLEHMGLKITRKEEVLPQPVYSKVADVEWQDALKHFESDPSLATAQLMVQSYCLRKNFLEIRKERGPVDAQELFGFRQLCVGEDDKVTYREFRDMLLNASSDALYRFRIFMELRGLMVLDINQCHYV